MIRYRNSESRLRQTADFNLHHALDQIQSLLTGFEIYFYVQLPLGQPQDLVWLPIEYFGCPSSCPSSSQETNTASCLMRLTYFMFFLIPSRRKLLLPFSLPKADLSFENCLQ